MRRTARALSVALVAGAALALGGPTASADAAADAGPRTPSAGCASIPGRPPDTAAPVTGDDAGRVPGPATGGARAGPRLPGPEAADRADGACRTATAAPREPGTAAARTAGPAPCTGTQQQCGATHSGATHGCTSDTSCGTGGQCRAGQQCQDGGRSCAGGGSGCGDDDHRCDASHGGYCPAPEGDNCSEDRDTDDCAPAAVQHGVAAGAGGTFTGSVPALVAGGLCIAAACAGAGYRIHGGRRSAKGRPTGV